MNKFEFYKDLHYRELDRKYSLTNALALPIGISTIISSGMVYVAKSLGKIEGGLEWTVLVILGLCTLSLIIAIYFLYRSYIGYEYGYLPTSKYISEYRDGLIEYYNPDPEAIKLAEAEVDDYISSKFAETSHKNAINNDQKSGYLRLANLSIMAALVFMMLSALPIIVQSFEIDWSSIYTRLRSNL